MTTALEGAEGSVSRPGRSLPPGKIRYSLYRRLCGPQGRSGQVRKISPPTGIRSPDRRYTYYATRPTITTVHRQLNSHEFIQPPSSCRKNPRIHTNARRRSRRLDCPFFPTL